VELKNLQKHVRTLTGLPETDAPVVGCYLTVHNGRIKHRIALEGHVSPLTRGLTGQMRQDFEDALEPIGQYLTEELLPEANGVTQINGVVDRPWRGGRVFASWREGSGGSGRATRPPGSGCLRSA
jgi:hypothetical protein